MAAFLDASVFVQVLNSIVSHGCFLTDCSVEHSVIGIRSRLQPGVQLKVNPRMYYYLFVLEEEMGPVLIGIGSQPARFIIGVILKKPYQCSINKDTV